jgi:hypothetical protein
VFHFTAQSPERCSRIVFLATAESPSDSLPAATVKRLDDPKFVVFFYEMPHLVKLDFLNILGNLRLRRVETGFALYYFSGQR